MHHPQSRIRDLRQISRGKFDRLPCIAAESTFCALDGNGLRETEPARPTLTPYIRFLFIGAHFCSTLPSDPASRRRPCVSLTLPGRPGDLHPESPTDPDVNLSIHPARATQRRLPPSIKTRSSSGFPLTPPRRGWPAPFAPRELPRFFAITKQCAPDRCIGTFGLVGSPLVPFPFASPTRFSSSARKPR